MNNLEKNTGISEYPTFSESTNYSTGDVVNYNGLLYTFTTDHAIGHWDERQVESASLKGQVEQKLNKINGSLNLNPVKEDNSGDLKVIDSNGNVVFIISNDGLGVNRLRILDNDGSLVGKITSSNILTFLNPLIEDDGRKNFLIKDSNNNIVLLIDKDGVKVNKLIIANNSGQEKKVITDEYLSDLESKSDLITKTLIVKKEGSGDFTKIVDAVNSISDSSNKLYNIFIYPGEYDIINEYFDDRDYTDVSDKGLTLPNNVNLIGVGNVDDVVIKAEFPSTIKYRTSSSFSAINLRGRNNTLKNLTITAYNCRYPVHDQSSKGNDLDEYTHHYYNCKFIHKGYDEGATGSSDTVTDLNNTTLYRWNSCHALGQGTNATAHITAEFTEFCVENSEGFPFLTHDAMEEQVCGTDIVLSCCKFTNSKGSNLIKVSSLGRNYSNSIAISNCRINVTNPLLYCGISSSGYNESFIYKLCGTIQAAGLQVTIPEGYEENNWLNF